MLEPPARPRGHKPQGEGRAARPAELSSSLNLSLPSEAAERGSAEPRSATMRARRAARSFQHRT
eukprot:11143694-Alexandrium_andersonii.AAC.1